MADEEDTAISLPAHATSVSHDTTLRDENRIAGTLPPLDGRSRQF